MTPLLLLLAIATVLLPATPASAAGNIFVRIPGLSFLSACGSSTATGFLGDIVATSLTQEFSRQVDDKTGLPAGTKLNRTLTLIKAPDRCSPDLFLNAVGRSPAINPTLTVNVFFTTSTLEISTKLIITDAVITKIQVVPSQIGELQEIIEFGIMGTFEVIQYPRNPDGSPGVPHSQCWDFQLNRYC